MKLKQLTLHNIASIEDAQIDFEAFPLSSSDVFLITGKTGAGKSTILDAICLALYDNTPRFESNLSEGNIESDDDIRTDNPRQILRRNTGEGFVRLSFSGSNGVDYEAEWNVWRARNKPTGALQPRRWSLKRIDDNVVLTKVNEIEAEIAEAVGLDFTQFCRTSILAQGEFSKFLNSKDNDKAAILERITGTEIYTHIGARIHEITAENAQIWKESVKKIENVKLLDENEIIEIKGQLTELKAKETEIEKKLQNLQFKREWLNKQKELSDNLSTAQEIAHLALKTSEDEEFLLKKQLVSDWGATIQPRKLLEEVDSAQRKIVFESNRLQELKTQFIRFLGGIQQKEYKLKNLENRIAQVDHFFETEEPRRKTIENFAAIKIYISSLIEDKLEISKHQSKINEAGIRLKTSQASKNEFSVLYDNLKNEIQNKTDNINSVEKEIENLKPEALRVRKDEISRLISEIKLAQVGVANFYEELRQLDNLQQTLEDEIGHVKEKERELEELRKKLNETSAREEKARSVYESQKDTIEKFAKTLRSRLHIGDDCPVCRQKIKHSFVPEDELESMIKAYKTEWEELLALLDTRRTGFNKVEAEITAKKTQIENQQKSLLENKQRIELKRESLVSQLVKLGGVELTDDVNVKLEDLLQKYYQTARNLNEVISQIESKEKLIKDYRKQYSELQQKFENTQRRLQEINESINTCNTSLEVSQNIINDRISSISNTEESLGELIVGDWNNDWHAMPEPFLNELKTAVERFAENKLLRESLAKQLSDEKNSYSELVSIREKISLKLKHFTVSDATLIPSDIDNIVSVGNVLFSEITAVLNNIALYEKDKMEKESNLNEILGSMPQFTRESLLKLNNVDAETVKSINQEISDVTNKLKVAQITLDEAKKRIDEHAQNKPVFEDGETSEFIEQSITLEETFRKTIRENVGRYSQKLEDNDKGLAAVADLKKEADEKKSQYDKWCNIDRYFGSSDGKLFRKIAQSYVLESLIHSANHYMNSLSGRYVLKNIPGTFVIMVVDAFQGGTARAAATMSGGETFLASLALALALSDIGDKMGMDTLFIDEGFGTLSGEPLQKAIETLRTLHSRTGRHVGIISHVEELQERIPVQIRVEQDGNSSASHIKVVSGIQNL